MSECVRTVYDFENQGKIPCTGVYRCVFCGYVKERNNQNEKG